MRFQESEDIQAYADTLHGQMLAIMADDEVCAQHMEFIQQCDDEAHSEAYDEAYTPGGRRRSVRFDDQRYVNRYVELLTQRAIAEKFDDLAQSLRELDLTLE